MQILQKAKMLQGGFWQGRFGYPTIASIMQHPDQPTTGDVPSDAAPSRTESIGFSVFGLSGRWPGPPTLNDGTEAAAEKMKGRRGSRGHMSMEHKALILRLRDQISRLQDQNLKLSNRVQALEQGQDFRSFYTVTGTPHDKMQKRLTRVRAEIQGWSRMAHKDLVARNATVSLLGALEAQLPGFAAARRHVCHPDATPQTLQDANVALADVFAAIASGIVVEHAVVNPLAMRTDTFRRAVDSDVYRAMSSHTSTTDSILSAISQTLKPAFDILGLDLDDARMQRKLRDAVREAAAIGKEFGELQSGLVLMDQTWLRRHASLLDDTGCISPSDMGSRIEFKFDPVEEGKKLVRAKAAVVLFPGLLKYGTDGGDNWDTWTVWIPARVQLTDVETEQLPVAITQPSPPQSVKPSIPRGNSEEMKWTAVTTTASNRPGPNLPVNPTPYPVPRPQPIPEDEHTHPGPNPNEGTAKCDTSKQFPLQPGPAHVVSSNRHSFIPPPFFHGAHMAGEMASLSLDPARPFGSQQRQRIPHFSTDADAEANDHSVE
ncbi:hypothetical protein B0T26DRAFT_799487 [Lasiosphaeria miniovina]|uniref:Uncharacterized protein n=1 Tax=Lasiosphaeria miniovina TaxID=1954250 RepID=A0AA40B4K3_9PEZI|nr:uncharacterized protein B0T26DRAFT_799487 [Lasiosphaeria miniovina]KAK0727479.1 hypothetical protein B0T26DRAFT_799487 [Lasiosphaeria miniovina]